MTKYAKSWIDFNHKEEDSLLGKICLTLFAGFAAFVSIYGLIINLKAI